jgi:SnoaL-like domain
MPIAEPAQVLPLRAAMEARDLVAACNAFAPHAVLYSPLTRGLAFEGREQIGALIEVLLDALVDLRYTAEGRGGDSAFLVASARVGGEQLELADHLRLDADGLITEMTAFFRPLPATAAALRALGAGLARRKSPARAAIVSALTGPLCLMTKAGDGVGVRLVRGALPQG